MIDNLGGRKVVLGLVFLAVATAVVYFKGDLPTNLEDLMKYLFAAFAASNAVENASNAFGKNS